jgi:ribosomal protein S18 acetylase RimI-like enzyme
MLAAVQIRSARPQEYPAVGTLTVDVYLGDKLVPPGAVYLDTLVNAADRADRAELIVAVDADGTVIGSVTFAQYGSAYAELAEADEVEIRMLVVAPSARGQGLGEALVRTCLDRAKAAGAVRVRLSTQENMVGAHPIYRRLGFVRTPERDWSPVAGVNLLTYELPLG